MFLLSLRLFRLFLLNKWAVIWTVFNLQTLREAIALCVCVVLRGSRFFFVDAVLEAVVGRGRPFPLAAGAFGEVAVTQVEDVVLDVVGGRVFRLAVESGVLAEVKLALLRVDDGGDAVVATGGAMNAD